MSNMYKNNKTKFRLLGFNLVFDILIFSMLLRAEFDCLIFIQFVQNQIWSKMLGFVKSWMSFWSNTRVREKILDFTGYEKFPHTINRLEKVRFCWICKSFLTNTHESNNLVDSSRYLIKQLNSKLLVTDNSDITVIT